MCIREVTNLCKTFEELGIIKKIIVRACVSLLTRACAHISNKKPYPQTFCPNCSPSLEQSQCVSRETKEQK